MTVGSHYLDEDDAKRIITIPISAALLDDWLETALTLIDGRINLKCYISTNTTDTMESNALASVELNAMQKVIQNTRLSREGVPSEVAFIDSWFSAEDKLMMMDIKERHKFVAVGHARDAEV